MYVKKSLFSKNLLEMPRKYFPKNLKFANTQMCIHVKDVEINYLYVVDVILILALICVRSVD